MSQKSSSSNGIGFTGLLQLLFIGLKIGKVVKWTWPVVFLPFEIMGGLIAIVLIVVVLIAARRRR